MERRRVVFLKGGKKNTVFKMQRLWKKEPIVANENGRQNKCYPGYLLKLLKENKL